VLGVLMHVCRRDPSYQSERVCVRTCSVGLMAVLIKQRDGFWISAWVIMRGSDKQIVRRSLDYKPKTQRRGEDGCHPTN